MMKQIWLRKYTEDNNPMIEALYETEFGIIHSAPDYSGGGWEQVEHECTRKAYYKYMELIKENGKLIEA